MADAAVALITGSTRGIGWATARVLARDGMAIAVCGRAAAEAAERAKASSDVDQEEVAKHFEEMTELGAQVKGEGEIK